MTVNHRAHSLPNTPNDPISKCIEKTNANRGDELIDVISVLNSICFSFVDIGRSPWSNIYEPPLEDGTVPSEEMRNLEVEANEVFSVYRDQ